MVTLTDRVRALAPMSSQQAEHLRRLLGCWQVLADLSFSDLLLYVRVGDDDLFEICGQLRPLTSQTLYPQDMVGVRVTQPDQPAVERAFREGRIWAQEDPVLVNGIQVQMDAVPVRYEKDVIAVVAKEGSPSITRRLGHLEEVYLRVAASISHMIENGSFPFPHAPLDEWPRVGEGMFLLDRSGGIEWASPNALSSLHRLGLAHPSPGDRLDDFGFDNAPAATAIDSCAIVDSELVSGDTSVRVRVMPLVEDGEATGVLALARDVSELRQKERVISVKDATIREIHHRVKNNLQTIASLLRLQARRVGSPEARSALQESELRIGSIALVHETLSESSTDVADFGDVARRIARMVSDGLVLPERKIAIDVTGATGPLPAEVATPLAVTLAELMQNAVEHAFPDGRSGTIDVEVYSRDSWVGAIVRDDGVGISGNVADVARLGLQIVRTLVHELGGTLELTTDGGTCAQVQVPTKVRG